jgi:hypothetical protein
MTTKPNAKAARSEPNPSRPRLNHRRSPRAIEPSCSPVEPSLAQSPENAWERMRRFLSTHGTVPQRGAPFVVTDAYIQQPVPAELEATLVKAQDELAARGRTHELGQSHHSATIRKPRR